VRVVRHQKKPTPPPRRKRSETRQGYVFEATADVPARRVNWEPLATFWRTRGGVVLSTLLLAVTAWLSYVFFGTDDFYVYSAAVEGNLVVPAEEIFYASELDSQSIFWVNPGRTAEVVAGLPDIKSAEVECRLPAQVTIRVVERQARVVWQWQDRQFWVDDHGVVLKPRGALPDALSVYDKSADPPRLGGRVDARAVVAAQQLCDLRPQLRAVVYDPDRGLTLESEGGWLIYLGVGDDMALKLAILEALETDLRKQGIRPAYIDLRYSQRPTYRQRQEP
jgi:cell division septal protein FtsQ